MAELAREKIGSERALGVRREDSRLGGTITLRSTPFQLQCGRVLPEVRIAYEMVGPSDAPVIAVLGGISATRHVSAAGAAVKGWWSDLCGPNLALDTRRYRLLSWDFLGGNGQTCGPRSRQDWHHDQFEVTTIDQAKLATALLTELKIAKLHAFVGASYGGMIALAFAKLEPSRVGRLIVIGAAHRSAPLAIAWRTIQRQIVQFGLSADRGSEGLALARALGMSTYRSADEFTQRFGGDRLDSCDPDSFPVWSYLKARGDDYVKLMDPHAFVTLSRSIDLHHLDPTQLSVPATLVAVRQDQIVPLSLMSEFADGYQGPCDLQVIDSLYGHDAFLKEPTYFSRLLRCL